MVDAALRALASTKALSRLKVRLGLLVQGHHLGTYLGLGRCQIRRDRRKTSRNMLVPVLSVRY